MRTLEELEGEVWPSPEFDSHLVTRCHELRKVPVPEMSPEDLRILIGQQIGVVHLAPYAIAILEKDPLAEGDFYPGDLLLALIRLPAKAWEAYPHLLAPVRQVAKRAQIALTVPGAEDVLPEPLRSEVLAEILGFLGVPPPNNSLQGRRP